ncbi:hypothetical protein [uncultured Methylibium sp.]|uniref:hypothetical protein n=1 Tax=uncultured Methylibium sp. TaxID=381093 RepID=UPI0025FBDBF5|nr:hypothetical protein [uncultured Methylibium sp.]
MSTGSIWAYLGVGALVLMIIMAIACWCVVIKLMVTKQMKTPHEVMDLALAGNRLARLNFKFAGVAALAFAVLVVCALVDK